MNTLLLDAATWDLVLDANGNIAMASEPYSIAQDVASAGRLFSGELWYDTDKGTPYFSTVLGERPPVTLIKAQKVQSSLTVPAVTDANCFITSFNNRGIEGQIQVTDIYGSTTVVNI